MMPFVIRCRRMWQALFQEKED